MWPLSDWLQVVVAMDDSKSMSENGCGMFALEALTLICQAMSRVEVRFAVASSDPTFPGAFAGLGTDTEGCDTCRWASWAW